MKVETTDSGLSPEGMTRLQPQKVRTIVDDVMQSIRLAILSSKLPPGSRLRQSELAKQLGVSITPVREALRELTSAGLVDFDPYRGAVVHTPTTEELENVYAIRAQLMPLNIRLGILNITDAQLAEARALTRLMEQARDQGIWVELNRQFHRILDGAHENEQLRDILGGLSDLSELYVNLAAGARGSRRESADVEHRELLDAYGARDVERAVRITEQHLQTTVEAAKAAFKAPVADKFA